ncbi:arginine--tRNA ligase [Gorillibacterium timonense]|uniref:arginine--tRNA ligase n=1 Tax=Gorillibacterium timonense TaxID=1689269 RepID=UPI00071E4A91|nr:arginine--tRNA ligase [Gorillibacterium timonense]
MPTLSETIIQGLSNAVHQIVENGERRDPPPLVLHLEQPTYLEHGDYSTNAPLQLAKVLRQPPQQIAHAIKAKLEADGYLDHLLSRIEVAPPGFLNLFLDWEQWAGREFTVPQNPGEKAVIEHTSINPNKSAHIGHLRNSCIGDTLARLMRRVGYQVEVHNYIDDLGNQLADTVVGLLHLPYEHDHSRFGDYCWDLYARVNREYEASPELAAERTNVLHSLEKGDDNTAWIGLLAAERIVREHLDEMKAFDVGYDLLVWESEIVREGFWDSAFHLLQQTGHFYQESAGALQGCWVLTQGSSAAGTNDSEHIADKVLVRSNGILTYTAKDIAYHLWKFGLLDKDFRYKAFADGIGSTHRAGTTGEFGGADLVVNVIDYRQHYPQAMVKQAFELLGFQAQAQKLRHVSYGVVSLSPAAAEELGIDTSAGKPSYAMSGRQGIGIKVTELLDRMEAVIETKRSDKQGLPSRTIAAAAIRYYLLRFSLPTEVIFDIGQATETTGNSGVYLMYSHARAANLLSKAGITSPPAPSFPAQPVKAELALLKQLAHWPDTLHLASCELSPSLICSYAHELAVLFNAFYGAVPILKAPDGELGFRLWLTSKFQETMADALSVLGLPAPNRM